jgi:WAS family protein 1
VIIFSTLGLKSVREQKAEEKQSKAAAAKAGKAVKGGGGDLMSDLANKLALRRKGISGTSIRSF